MDRTGFTTTSPMKGLPLPSSTSSSSSSSLSKKMFLIRLPKGTDLNILDGLTFDLTKGKADNIYKDEESEFNCHLDSNTRDFVRPIVSDKKGDLRIGPKFEGTITVTRKFTPPPRLEANVRTCYVSYTICTCTYIFPRLPTYVPI